MYDIPKINEQVAQEILDTFMGISQKRTARLSKGAGRVHFTELTFDFDAEDNELANHRNTLRAMQSPKFADTIDSVASIGVRQALEVFKPGRKAGDKSLVVNSGHMRTAAVAAAIYFGLFSSEDDKAYLPIFCPDDIAGSLSLRERTSLDTNVRKIDLTPCETARGYNRYILAIHREEGGKKSEIKKRVAKEYRISTKTLNRLLSLLNMPKNIQSKVDSGEIPVSEAYKIAALKKSSAMSEAAERYVKTGSVESIEVTEEVSITTEGTPRNVSTPAYDDFSEAEESPALEGDFEEGSFSDLDDEEGDPDDLGGNYDEDLVEQKPTVSYVLTPPQALRSADFADESGADLVAQTIRFLLGENDLSLQDLIDNEARVVQQPTAL